MRTVRTTIAAAAVVALAAGLVSAVPAAAEDVDVAPLRTAGADLISPIGIEHDAAGNIYIADQAANALVIHAHNATSASSPLRVLSGGLTGIAAARDVALDANGFAYVVNNDGSVKVFAPGQQNNVAPVKSFGTGPESTWGIDIAQGEIFVRKQNSIRVYPLSATGNPAPVKREITGLGSGRSIAVADGKIWTSSAGQLRAYGTSASGAAAPLQTIVNAVDDIEVNGIDVDDRGRVYTGNFISRTVKVFAGDADGATPPLKVLGGPASGLDRPTGVAVLPQGQLVVADFGPGRYSVFAKLFDDRTTPTEVRSVKVKGKAKAKKRTIVWKAPAADGGADITAYRVVIKKGKKTLVTKNVKASKRKIVVKRSKLRKGKHVVRIQAKNVLGYGPVVKQTFRVKK